MSQLLTFKPFSNPEHKPFQLTGTRSAALLCVHGFPGTPAEVRLACETFHGQGYTCEGLLLPGFGAEMIDLTQYRVEDWVKAVVEAGRALQASHERLILVGNSMGAAVCILAARELSVDGLILFAPFTGFDNKTLPILDFVLGPFIKKISPFKLMSVDFNDPETRVNIGQFLPDADLDDPSVQAEIKNVSLPTGMLRQALRAARLGRRCANYVQVPTLILQGRQDALVTPKRTRKFVAQFQTRVTYIEVDDGHELIGTGSAAHIQSLQHCLEFLTHVCYC